MTKHKAMIARTNARGTTYWAGIGPWRDTSAAAKLDADAYRAEMVLGAKIRIYSLTSERY